jgi:RNA recognition motif-containing protein
MNRVTIVKDRASRASTGQAFALFRSRESANICVKAMDGAELNGVKLESRIARDNGRSIEFVGLRKRYEGGRCFECGVSFWSVPFFTLPVLWSLVFEVSQEHTWRAPHREAAKETTAT